MNLIEEVIQTPPPTPVQDLSIGFLKYQGFIFTEVSRLNIAPLMFKIQQQQHTQ